MYSHSTKSFSRALYLAFIFSFFLQNFLSAQTTFRISKPIIGTNQICSSSSNGYNNLSYAFSSNVVNSWGYSPQHSVELSNENGLISPQDVTYSYPNPNQIYTSSFDISSLNLPAGSGYKIRVYSNSIPSPEYSDYSETFIVLASPAKPTLNVSGSVSLCPGIAQPLTVTNPENGITYQWQNYSSNIANATNTTYTATTDGSYSIKAVASNRCSVASNSVYVSRISALGSYLSAYLPYNYYGGNPLFTLPNQAFLLRANFSGGKPPYGFTLNDGTTNTIETNISYSKDYNLISPSTGSRTYTLTNITDACGTQLTNTASARVRINESNYCSTSGQGLTAISSFSIQGTTINNLNSGKSGDGWGEFLIPANINANVNYNFTIASNNLNQKFFAIWADLNQNNVFDNNEKIFPTSANNYYGQTMTNSFTGRLKLPMTTYNGQVRMRVQLSDDSYSANYNCNSLQSGEIEDYVLRVFNGLSPTTITTDSLPRLGICKNGTFNLSFTVTGSSLPANTTYRVEVSDNANFSNSYIIGTGQTSPISCYTTNLYSSYNYYARVVQTTVNPQTVFVKAPNQLYVKASPTAYLAPIFFDNNWPNPNWGCCYGTGPSAGLFVAENSGPYAVYAGVSSYNTNFPITVTMSDGRVFTVNSASIGGAIIRIDSNIVANGVKKYKIAQVSNSLCTNNKPDSLLIRSGNPYLKIMKVYKGNYNDTTSISKLCSYFQVKFAGDFLDTLGFKFYHVQISDVNGSFVNPQDIGHVCIYKVYNELQGGQEISCSIPSGLAPGNGYRLRIVKKTGNVISPIYSTIFEVLDPTTISFTANLARNVINEGEVTALNINFTAGTPPYSLYIDNNYTSQTYTTAGSNTSMTINLAPTNGTQYQLYSYGTNACGNNNRLSKLIDVRTLDKDNSQWYIKPITNNTYYFSFYDYLKKMSLSNSSDTLLKKTFSNYYNSQIVNSYYDYNSPNLLTTKSTLQIGESYTFSQTDNNNYFNNSLTGIWIDANQDGDFDDIGEELAKNQFGSPWNLTQNQTFTIPSNTNIGFSRIRVRTVTKGYNAEPFDLYASNPLSKYGVTFDIPIVVLSNSVTSVISTPKISGNTLCNGNSFRVDFSKYGILLGTSASVELSDIAGNFPTTPTVIGQGTTSSVNVTLPLTVPSGNYNIRVVSNGITSPISPAFNVSSNQLSSMVDGDWHAGSTWSCGRVPTYLDATTVAGGTTVTVFSGDARVGSIITNGVLSFLNGTTLQFRTP